MRIMKFEGATMRDAIAKVKQELGDQAVIVATRQIRRGLIGGTAYEISAAIDDDGHTGPTSGGPITQSYAAASQPAPPPAPAPSPRDEAELQKLMAPLRSELRSLRALVRAAGDGRVTTELRGELASLRKLVEGLAPNVVATPTTAKATATATAASSAHAGAPRSLALTQPSTAHAILLVGPTGAGKTTTIAKLAARAALIDGRTVHLVTLDDYRVGGVDRDPHVRRADRHPAPRRADRRAAARAVRGRGRAHADRHRRPQPARHAPIAELAELVHGLPIETHLVAPAALAASAIDDLARRYRALAPARLLVTKLDEVEDASELAAAPARLARCRSRGSRPVRPCPKISKSRPPASARVRRRRAV